MSFALQSQKITGSGEATFSFGSSKVGAYVYAIQQLNLVQNGNDYLQRIGVSLSPQDGTGVGHENLVLKQTITMDAADLETSWTVVSVLAWLGAADPAGIFLQNHNGVSMGSTSEPLDTAGAAPIVAAAALAGFDFNFSSDDSYILGIGVSCGAVPNLFTASNTNSIAALAKGTLNGEASFSGTVDTALLAFTALPALGFGITGVGTVDSWHKSAFGPVFPYDGSVELESAAFFISSFFAQFNYLSMVPTGGNVMTQLQLGVPPNNVTVGQPLPGDVDFFSTQQLLPAPRGAGNLQTNFVVVALPQAT